MEKLVSEHRLACISHRRARRERRGICNVNIISLREESPVLRPRRPLRLMKIIRSRFPRLYRRGTYFFRLCLSSNCVAENGSHPRLHRRGTPAKLDNRCPLKNLCKIQFCNKSQNGLSFAPLATMFSDAVFSTEQQSAISDARVLLIPRLFSPVKFARQSIPLAPKRIIHNQKIAALSLDSHHIIN